MQQQLASPVGLYGKLPCKGDFLQRRISQEFVDGWDPWLQECMYASRQQLGEEWLQAYLNGPVWRFALAEGACGGGAYAGVMVPSVDRVGRYFPLALVAQLGTDECLLEVACGASAWFDAAEALAVEALQAADLDLESFDDQVAALAGYLERSSAGEAAYLASLMQQADFAHAPAQWQVPLAAGYSLQNAVNAFASRELARVLRPLALWWSDGSEAVAPAWLATRGLPDAATFAALLAGNWRTAGWATLSGDASPPPRQASPAGEWPAVAAPAPLELSAWHAPVLRIAGAPEPRTQFVARPELGLWAVVCAEQTPADARAAVLIADVLQGLPQANTLSELAESVRQALQGAYRELARRAQGGSVPAARTIVFVARDAECALVWAGEVQAVRCRSADALPMLGMASSESGGDPFARTEAPRGGLLELIAAPLAAENSILVHYQPLQSGDTWVLAGALLIEPRQLPALAAALAPQVHSESWGPLALQSIGGVDSAAYGGTAPLLMLAARQVRRG